ncbi:hypothetical protein NHJ6243_000303 [Beauveria neobassiana]
MADGPEMMEITAPSSSAGTCPNPQASLQVAIQDFQSILTDGQRHKLRTIGSIRDAQSVMIFTAQLEHENRLAGRPGVSNRLSTVLESVQAFAGVVGTFVSSHPEIAALVWGSVKLTMLIAVNFVSYFEALSSIFMTVGRQCPRFAEYQALYPASTRLQGALCDFHASIIRKQHLKHAIFKSFQEEMQEDVRAVQQMGEEVKEEISLATARAQHEDEELQARERRAAFRDRSKMWKFLPRMEHDISAIKEMHEQQLRRKAKEERQRLLESLSSHEYRTPFWEACKKRQRDTAEWIFAVPEFKRWYDGSGPSLLWCSGKIGSGKTVLCANVVNHVFLHKGRHDTATFFFVDRDNAESLQAETLIRSIIRQSIDSTEVPQYLESRLTNLDHAVFVQLDAWIDLLRYVVQQSTAFYILIDGLDECDAAERQAVFDALSLLAATASCLRIFISSRESVDLDLRGRSLPMSRVSMSCDSLMSDIRSYIDTSLQKRLQNEELAFGDAHLLVEVNDALTQHADGIGQTALQAACGGGHLEVVERLLGAGADVNTAVTKHSGQTALQAASGAGHLEVVERLIDAGADVNAATAEVKQLRALQEVSSSGHLEGVVDDHLDRVLDGHLEVVERLLIAKADADASGLENEGLTALQVASKRGHLQVVDFLLGAGADVNADAAPLEGLTALQAASSGGHVTVVERLLYAGADVNAPGAVVEGLTALQAASSGGYFQVVDFLLGVGAWVNATPAFLRGVTALQAASGSGHIEVVKRLLRAGADVNTAASRIGGRTALQVASDRGHLKIVELLLAAGADDDDAAI